MTVHYLTVSSIDQWSRSLVLHEKHPEKMITVKQYSDVAAVSTVARFTTERLQDHNLYRLPIASHSGRFNILGGWMKRRDNQISDKMHKTRELSIPTQWAWFDGKRTRWMYVMRRANKDLNWLSIACVQTDKVAGMGRHSARSQLPNKGRPTNSM